MSQVPNNIDDIEEIENQEFQDLLNMPLPDIPEDDEPVMINVQVETTGPVEAAAVCKPPGKCRVNRKKSMVWPHFSSFNDAKGDE
ncbi:OLC1v1003228C1 [Oldenlandia corymbosa var. corymbosa]|uniref:OLC1v1003228C1 n=1 Tax=Oldenlandia corymbosa var. corymbosa TaxID=529605 RepID=A0AAV1DAU1_OLDCO|nr:OLC1v1003228C1 [Oldenlandia corymbosa var. corymbosa]